MKKTISEANFMHLCQHPDSQKSARIMEEIRDGGSAPCSKELMSWAMLEGTDELKEVCVRNWKNGGKDVSEDDMFQWLSFADDNRVKTQLLRYWAHKLPAYELHRLVVAKSSDYNVKLGILLNESADISEELSLHIIKLSDTSPPMVVENMRLQNILLMSKRFKPTEKILHACEISKSNIVRDAYEKMQNEWGRSIILKSANVDDNAKKKSLSVL